VVGHLEQEGSVMGKNKDKDKGKKQQGSVANFHLSPE
jgi:hypothetical protein